MTGFLVRVGIDQAFGGWNAPVDPTSLDFVYVPIPEGERVVARPGMGHRFSQFEAPLAAFEKRVGVEDTALIQLPESLRDKLVHLDPDFEQLTYGDDGLRRGREIAALKPGDLIAFYAGLRPVRKTEQRLLYGLIGLLIVERICRVKQLEKSAYSRNAHTRKNQLSDDDVVVFANREKSGRLRRCIPIGSFRERAYRVREDLLDAWGKLSVKNGYIQRSAVPPRFKNAEAFYEWFQSQEPELIHHNNV